MEAATTLEIALLQVSRSVEKPTALSCAGLRDFAVWAKLRPWSGLVPREFDRPGASHLDHLFFGNYQAVEREELWSAVPVFIPATDDAATGSLPLLRVGTGSFRDRSHSPSRAPWLRRGLAALGAFGNIGKLGITGAGTSGASGVRSGAKFTKTFNDTMLQLGPPTATVAYQLRRGAALRAAQRVARYLAEIQRRLRHAGPAHTQRYGRRARQRGEQRLLTPKLRGRNAWGGSPRHAPLLGTILLNSSEELCSARRRAHHRALSMSSGPPAKQLLTVGRPSS
jgi:hypothetical protein